MRESRFKSRVTGKEKEMLQAEGAGMGGSEGKEERPRVLQGPLGGVAVMC